MNTRIESPMDPFRAWMDAGTGEPLRKSMLQQMERFWQGQKKLLDEYETFSRAMLERRKGAAEATLDLLKKMNTAADGTEWAKCCTDWVTGSVTRMTEDGRDMIAEGMKMFAEVSQTLSAGMAEVAQAGAETQQAAARSATVQAAAMGEHGAASAQEAARMAAARASQRPKRPDEGARAGAAE